MSEVKQRLLGELRDYFAHMAMRIEWARSREDHKAIIKYFNQCFDGVDINGKTESTESTASALMNRGDDED
jgi:hypothetical protein